jgi:membrane protein required for colicin V production
MIIDLICGLLLVLGFMSGYKNGIIKTAFSTVSIFIGILAALKLSPIVINLFEKIFNSDPRIAFILGFIATFFIVMLLVRAIGKFLEKFLKTIKLGFINKLAGGAFKALFLLLIFSTGLWFASEARFLSQSAKDRSITYPVLETLPKKALGSIDKIKPIFTDFWNKTVETMDSINEKHEGGN